VALKLLIELKKQEEKNLNMLVFLTTLPLKPEHRIINIRRLINQYIKLGHFDVAKSLLEIMIPLNLRDKEDLEKKYKECQHGANIPTQLTPKTPDGKLKFFCFSEFIPINGSHFECSVCKATFVKIDKTENALERCTYCTFGLLEKK